MPNPLVLCVKVGDKYSPDYVNKLYNMVQRHTTVKHDFICLTDSVDDLSYDYEHEKVWNINGWWTKLLVFNYFTDRRRIFLDLDTVIVNNIDFLFEFSGDFAICKDFFHPYVCNSSVMSIAPGYGKHIFDNWEPKMMEMMHGDQDWITWQVKDPSIWQQLYPGKVGSYKADNLKQSPGDYSVVCFHGVPKPHMINHGWVHDSWV